MSDEPVCSTCGKPKSGNALCSNAFHLHPSLDRGLGDNDSWTSPDMTAYRTESCTPSAYRLCKKKNGDLVLQGSFQWWEGALQGHDWKDIPTIEEGCVDSM